MERELLVYVDSASLTVDGWRKPFRIVCESDETVVVSTWRVPS